MAKLYPPLIEGSLPAFYEQKNGTVEITVPYTMNRAVAWDEIKGFQILIKSIQSNLQLYTGYSQKTKDSISFIINQKEWLKLGSFYKVQLAYVNNDNLVGYYSTVGIIKYISMPVLSIFPLSELGNITSQRMHDVYTFVGNYSQENGDLTEKVYSYSFDLIGENIEYHSGELIHDNSSNEFSADTWTLDNLINPGYYKVRYTVTTVNGAVFSIEDNRLVYGVLTDSHQYKIVSATLNYENGYVEFDIRTATPVWLIRVNNETNEKVRLCKFTETTEHWKDFTIEQGVTYTYQLYGLNDNETCLVDTNALNAKTIMADFEDAFLYDGDRQLKIKYNPKVSSFKIDVLEQKQDTLGSKTPIFFRNGNVYYHEFPISGLISYQMDEEQLFLFDDSRTLSSNLTTEVIKAEREFKMQVLEWLNNGKKKLFRSPGEGNYIVRLMNVSLSPEDKLGRMLHTFSCTAYEAEEYNIENLKLNKILKDQILDPPEERLWTRNEDYVIVPEESVLPDNIHLSQLHWNTITFLNDYKSISPNGMDMDEYLAKKELNLQNYDWYLNLQHRIELLQEQTGTSETIDELNQELSKYIDKFTQEDILFQQRLVNENPLWYNVLLNQTNTSEPYNLIQNGPAYALKFTDCQPGMMFLIETSETALDRNNPYFTIEIGVTGSYFIDNVIVNRVWFYNPNTDGINVSNSQIKDIFTEKGFALQGALTYLTIGEFMRDGNNEKTIVNSYTDTLFNQTAIVAADDINRGNNTLDVIPSFTNNQVKYLSMNHVNFRRRKFYVLDYFDLKLDDNRAVETQALSARQVGLALLKANPLFDLDPYGFYCIKNWPDEKTYHIYDGLFTAEIFNIEINPQTYEPLNLDLTIKINGSDFVLGPDRTAWSMYNRIYETAERVGYGTPLRRNLVMKNYEYMIDDELRHKATYKDYEDYLRNSNSDPNRTSIPTLDRDKQLLFGAINDPEVFAQHLEKYLIDYENYIIKPVNLVAPSALYIWVGDSGTGEIAKDYKRIYSLQDLPEGTPVYYFEEDTTSLPEEFSTVMIFSNDETLSYNSNVDIQSVVIGNGIQMEYSCDVQICLYVAELNKEKYHSLNSDRLAYYKYKEYVDSLIHGFKTTKDLVLPPSKNNNKLVYQNLKPQNLEVYFEYFIPVEGQITVNPLSIFRNFIDDEWSKNQHIYSIACGREDFQDKTYFNCLTEEISNFNLLLYLHFIPQLQGLYQNYMISLDYAIEQEAHAV